DQAPHDWTTGPSSQPEDDTSEKVIHETSSTFDLERTESEIEVAAPKDPKKVHEALAGPDPEPMQEDQTGSDSRKVHVSLAGPNPEHMDDEFLAIAYPKVHENLKLITDERVIEDNWNGYSKRKPKTTKPSTGWKRQSQSEAKVSQSQKSAT
ncbi:hypothetical protein Tco_0141323, partial [Tanacetum coccineum]